MGGLLRWTKMDQILKKIENQAHEQVYFFPIRHHSPACSYHLQRVVEEYKPEAILVEGPADTQQMIPLIVNEENKTPFALYYSYSEKGSTDKEPYYRASYFPFMEYSPELVALREAQKRGIDAAFIDLPYAHLEPSHTSIKEKEGYYNDDMVEHSRFIAELCKKEHCRSYAELWEKLFELRGIYVPTQQFVREMTAFCHSSRQSYTPQELEEEHCTVREAFMAAEIAKAKTRYQRILVVTGGFHTSGLITLLEEHVQPVVFPEKQAEVYLIRYSFQEADQLSGYASGMPYPQFYDLVWKQLGKQHDTAYQNTILHMLTKIGGKLRKAKEPISISDEASAFDMAKGLSVLRHKQSAGVYELLDGIQAAFIKGEMDVSANRIFAIAENVLRGDKIGDITAEAGVPAIVENFRELAARYHLQTQRVVSEETVLDIVANANHRALSIFFHQLDYLDIGFATLLSGPDYVRGQNTRLVRERWKYQYNARVETQLIDRSVYGNTVYEVAETMLEQSLINIATAQAGAVLMAYSIVMGLYEQTLIIQENMEQLLMQDGSFHSLCESLRILHGIQTAAHILRVPDLHQLEQLVKTNYLRCTLLFATLQTSIEQEDKDFATDLKFVYSLVLEEDYLDEILLIESVKMFINQPHCPPMTEGAARGILYTSGSISVQQLLLAAEYYLNAYGDVAKLVGRFLQGLFLTNRDVFFYSDMFLEGLDQTLTRLTTEEFLTILPDLRLAFTQFRPLEIVQISDRIAKRHGAAEKEFGMTVIEEQVLLLGQEIDRVIRQKKQEKGLFYGLL